MDLDKCLDIYPNNKQTVDPVLRNGRKRGDKVSIGSNVKKYRIKKSISQTELAEMVGVTQPAICKIEKDIKAPSLPTGKAIADVLGCRLDDLFE